jgi:hypothetical protein
LPGGGGPPPRRCAERRLREREAHASQRPEHGEREEHEQEVANEVEQREEIHQTEERSMERDDEEVRKVLVVDEGREAELELGCPEVERIRAACDRVGRSLNEEEVERVVVVAWDGNDDLGEERDRIEDDDGEDDREEEVLLRIEAAEPREGQRVGEGRADPVGVTRRASSRCAVANSVAASAVWPSERNAKPRL